MNNVLAEICAAKREEIAKCKRDVPLGALQENISLASPPRGFRRALENKLKAQPYALIAEIKKASPSGGLIRADFHPANLAAAYQKGGAACLSVVTDRSYFQGDDRYLAEARAAAELPCLRKDFMLDAYQIAESRALGADCVLLIMAALSDAQAKELEAAALELGMDALIEVHDEKELTRALTHLVSTLIGINNRNLGTLKVDLATAESLAKQLPGNILGIAESGLRALADLERMKRAGLSCFLVGESLMREPDVTQATKKLLGLP